MDGDSPLEGFGSVVVVVGSGAAPCMAENGVGVISKVKIIISVAIAM